MRVSNFGSTLGRILAMIPPHRVQCANISFHPETNSYTSEAISICRGTVTASAISRSVFPLSCDAMNAIVTNTTISPIILPPELRLSRQAIALISACRQARSLNLKSENHRRRLYRLLESTLSQAVYPWAVTRFD